MATDYAIETALKYAAFIGFLYGFNAPATPQGWLSV
jgi:hypothetical protein